MFRVNSISKQMLNFQVVTNGKLKMVNLLPGNFVFTDKLTSQIKNLELNKCVRTHEVKQRVVSPTTETKKVSAVANSTNVVTDSSEVKPTKAAASPKTTVTDKTSDVSK